MFSRRFGFPEERISRKHARNDKPDADLQSVAEISAREAARFANATAAFRETFFSIL